MNKLILLLWLIVITSIAFALKKDPAYRQARLKGARAKMELHILDEDGNVVPYVDVSVFMGMNFRPQGYWIKGNTDTNGVFHVEGITCGYEIEVVLSKGGYYTSTKKMCFATMGAERNVEDGKWQPYGEELAIELRRIHNPIELTQQDCFIDICETNRWMGFDMLVKDFVRPFGKGEESDIEIRAEWDGKAPIGSSMCQGELRFTKPIAGGYYVKKVVESYYPYAYGAKIDAEYAVSNIKVVNRMGDPGLTKVPFREDSVFVTRTRCVIDEMTGKLKSANYGYIKDFMVSPSWKGKCTLRLFYVFNPTPNDTNLEPKIR